MRRTDVWSTQRSHTSSRRRRFENRAWTIMVLKGATYILCLKCRSVDEVLRVVSKDKRYQNANESRSSRRTAPKQRLNRSTDASGASERLRRWEQAKETRSDRRANQRGGALREDWVCPAWTGANFKDKADCRICNVPRLGTETILRPLQTIRRYKVVRIEGLGYRHSTFKQPIRFRYTGELGIGPHRSPQL